MPIITHSIENQNETARRLIQSGEGKNISKPKNLHDHTITLGFGYTFIRKDSRGMWFVPRDLPIDLASIGILLTQKQRDNLAEFVLVQNDCNLTQADTLLSQFAAGWTAAPISNEQAEVLFSVELNRASDAIHNRFRTILGDADGDVLFASLENTREKAQ